MKTYRLDGTGPADGKPLARVAWMLLLATGFGVLVALRNTSVDSALWGVALAIPVLTVAQLAAMQRSRVRQRRQWASYRLVVEDDAVRRTVDGYADITIARRDIARIADQDSGLVVHGPSRDDQIFIPRQLTGFHDVRLQLAAWQPFEQTAPVRGFARQKPLLAAAGVMVLFGAVFLSERPLIVVPATTLFIAAELVALALTVRSPLVDARTKRAMLLLLLPTAAAGYRLVQVLSR
jgi:hypothetical protein